MRFKWGLVCVLGAVALATQVASASVIYEDNYYWLSDGTVMMNPTSPPVAALIKVEETVYADDQGRALLAALSQMGAISGDAIPTEAFDLYTYHITNMDFRGPNGISGFGVTNPGAVPILGLWAPTRAWDAWSGAVDVLGAGWSVNADQDVDLGDGWGILSGMTFGGFMFAVPEGTPHSTSIPAAVASWTGEEPNGVPTNILEGLVSGPIPEPATLALVGLGGALTILAGRRRR